MEAVGDTLRTRPIWFFSALSLEAAAAIGGDVAALAWLWFEARHLTDDAPNEIEP